MRNSSNRSCISTNNFAGFVARRSLRLALCGVPIRYSPPALGAATCAAGGVRSGIGPRRSGDRPQAVTARYTVPVHEHNDTLRGLWQRDHMRARDIHARKGLKRGQQILDSD